MSNLILHFDKDEMIQALKNNGYEVKKEQRSVIPPIIQMPKMSVDVEVFEKSVYIVYLGGIEIVDTSYPCQYKNLDIVEDVFFEILKRKLLKLVCTI